MMARIFSAYIILTVVCSVYCDLISDNNGTAAADINGEALLKLGRRLNKPVLTVMGMAIRNLEKLHPLCDDWTAWSDCGTVRLGYISTKRRNRKCSDMTNNLIHVRNETEINICEGFCPQDYNMTTNGYCMKLYVTKETLAEAEKRCQEDGGYLINVDSERKYEDVKSFVKGVSTGLYIYISGRRKDANSEWEFLYGKQTGFFKWASGTPGTSVICLVISASDFLWYGSATPTLKRPYLCEIIV